MFTSSRNALICFSHLRWDFVFQRPQHLMTRFAKQQAVYYWEEEITGESFERAALNIRKDASGVTIVTPNLPAGLSHEQRDAALAELLSAFVEREGLVSPDLWYYTPMMVAFSRALADRARVVVYDCMDELADFAFAPPALRELEQELFARAGVVFTGGHSLFEAKRDQHPNVHAFPSSVDVAHFAQARGLTEGAADQSALPGPRLGFYGVLDERLDLDLLDRLAAARPDWSVVLVGPVVKIDPATLPRRSNLHYLGARSYSELPAYLAGWDVAIMPFAINAATRFISPTKTPEYLAAGRPVVSTAITDVRRQYGDLEAVEISEDVEAFITACDRALALSAEPDAAWRAAVDARLATLSWDITQAQMTALMEASAKPTKIEVIRPAATPIASPAVFTTRRPPHYDALIVGAGFAGSVLAERLAAGSGSRVLLIDKRPHIGGNAYDGLDAAGVMVHHYGPHIFHTNSQEVFSYLSRFTEWRPYEHRVLANVRDQLVPIPINRTTLNALYGVDLADDAAAAAFLAARAEPVDKIRTSEDVVVSAVGRELYELFFRGYTRKQWGVDPSQLDRSVTSRVPTRTNTDDRYFGDRYQAMPKHGYTAMFDRMLDHENITISTATSYADVVGDVSYDRLIFTGPVDEFFNHRYGPLPYRSLRFEHETHDVEQYQPVAVVNYPSETTPYTRISEYKQLTGQRHAKTSITREYPSDVGDPYYPIPNAEAQALYKKYEALALARQDVDFVGRLATYRYYNMDQVVAQALATWRKRFDKTQASLSLEGAAAAAS